MFVCACLHQKFAPFSDHEALALQFDILKTGVTKTNQVSDQNSMPCETIEEAGKRFLILSEVSNMHLVTP